MSGVFRNIDPPHPLTARRVCTPPCLWCGGRTHSLGGEEVGYGGVNSSEDARHSSVLYLCKYFVVQRHPLEACLMDQKIASAPLFPSHGLHPVSWTRIVVPISFLPFLIQIVLHMRSTSCISSLGLHPLKLTCLCGLFLMHYFLLLHFLSVDPFITLPFLPFWTLLFVTCSKDYSYNACFLPFYLPSSSFPNTYGTSAESLLSNKIRQSKSNIQPRRFQNTTSYPVIF